MLKGIAKGPPLPREYADAFVALTVAAEALLGAKEPSAREIVALLLATADARQMIDRIVENARKRSVN